MRIMVFFDLPTYTAKDRREYSQFRKTLIKEGFIMMQESVYSKIALNSTMSKLIKERIVKNSPDEGLIQILVITEKQFAGIDYICGNNQNLKIDSTERLLVL